MRGKVRRVPLLAKAELITKTQMLLALVWLWFRAEAMTFVTKTKHSENTQALDLYALPFLLSRVTKHMHVYLFVLSLYFRRAIHTHALGVADGHNYKYSFSHFVSKAQTV